MTANWLSIGTQHANIEEQGAFTVEYIKPIHKKIKTSNRIPIELVKETIRLCIEYMEVSRRCVTPAQIWQKREGTESLVKEKYQQQNSINSKMTILKEQQGATVALSKLQTWAAMAANAKSCPSFYNRSDKIVVKLNDSALAEMIKKQPLKEVVQRIDAYLIRNNVTTNKL